MKKKTVQKKWEIMSLFFSHSAALFLDTRSGMTRETRNERVTERVYFADKPVNTHTTAVKKTCHLND